jgi:hypothetical protein
MAAQRRRHRAYFQMLPATPHKALSSWAARAQTISSQAGDLPRCGAATKKPRHRAGAFVSNAFYFKVPNQSSTSLRIWSLAKP